MTIVWIIIFLLLVTLFVFYISIRPNRIISNFTPEQFGVNYEKIEVKTNDNLLIRGWYIPAQIPTKKGIILLHGYPADKGDILPSRLFLHKNYNLLFIDFRYFGESEGAYSTVGRDEVLDVLAAIQFLKNRGNNRIALWGFSMGGAVALMTTERSKDVTAVIAESGYASLDRMAYDRFSIPLLKYPLGWLLRFWGWIFFQFDITGVSPEASAKQIHVPVLLMHSKQDNVISFENALLLQQALKNNPDVVISFWPNLQHGESPKEYQTIIANFLTKYL